MKKALKIVGIVLGVLALVVIGFVVYVELTWSLERSDTPFPQIEASEDPSLIARGEYLVHSVAHCSTCHQPGEIVKKHTLDREKPLSGGHEWDVGPFGTFVAQNLTPHPSGLGEWSDSEIARALKHAVDRRGQLMPFMRMATGPMSDEDVQAIMSYLRTLTPVETELPRDDYGFFAKFLSDEFDARMEESPPFVREGGISIERGRYLAEGPAACASCHTPRDPMEGFAATGPLMSGSKDAQPDETDEDMEFVTPNLTPHPETGHIVDWDEDTFLKRFRAGRVYLGSIMPWEAYGGMTDEDLRSIYRYLMQLPPTERKVGLSHRKAD